MSAANQLWSEVIPLGEGWETPQRFDGSVNIGSIQIHATGFASKYKDGRTLTGSAASIDKPVPDRAYYELMERTALYSAMQLHPQVALPEVDVKGRAIGEKLIGDLFPLSSHPNQWDFARSNGVACHFELAEAIRRAVWELAEREAILRSWYGLTRPVPVSRAEGPLWQLSPIYNVFHVEFPSVTTKTELGIDDHKVAGCFLFPKNKDTAPLVYGFGVGGHIEGALDAAERECLQRLGFLWHEKVPMTCAALKPTAVWHQEYYLVPSHHYKVLRWITMGHQEFRTDHSSVASRQFEPLIVSFVELTPKEWSGRIHIVKTIGEKAIPLLWGEPADAAHLTAVPQDLWIHPIV